MFVFYMQEKIKYHILTGLYCGAFTKSADSLELSKRETAISIGFAAIRHAVAVAAH